MDAFDAMADAGDGDSREATDDGWADGADEFDGDYNPWADRDPDPRCLDLLELHDQQLRDELLAIVDGHDALSYDGARSELFSFINNIDGEVQCVYTGQWVVTDEVPDPNTMNTEHTWCQSWGADTLPAKSDLNHLFPTLSYVNSVRSNYPFGEVYEVTWSEGGSLKGRDGWGATVFEPRDPHKGNCARAMFYFAVRYEMNISERQEEVLKGWNRFDPPDETERQRNDRVEQVQLKRNPFIDCPELVDQIEDF